MRSWVRTARHAVLLGLTGLLSASAAGAQVQVSADAALGKGSGTTTAGVSVVAQWRSMQIRAQLLDVATGSSWVGVEGGLDGQVVSRSYTTRTSSLGLDYVAQLAPRVAVTAGGSVGVRRVEGDPAATRTWRMPASLALGAIAGPPDGVRLYARSEWQALSFELPHERVQVGVQVPLPF